MRRNKKNDNNHGNPKLTLLRKIQLEKEIENLIAKLSDDDVIELEKIGELTPEEIEYIKKRRTKRKKKSKKEKFEESIRVDEETIQRIILVSKNYADTQKLLKENRIKEKEKIRDKTREFGGNKNKNERSIGGR